MTFESGEQKEDWLRKMAAYRAARPKYAECRLRAMLQYLPHDWDDNTPKEWALELQAEWQINPEGLRL